MSDGVRVPAGRPRGLPVRPFNLRRRRPRGPRARPRPRRRLPRRPRRVTAPSSTVTAPSSTVTAPSSTVTAPPSTVAAPSSTATGPPSTASATPPRPPAPSPPTSTAPTLPAAPPAVSSAPSAAPDGARPLASVHRAISAPRAGDAGAGAFVGAHAASGPRGGHPERDATGAGFGDVDVQVGSRRDAGGELRDYVVTLKDAAGTAFTGADVRLQGRMADRRLVEVVLDPASRPGQYRAEVRVSPDGPADLRLRITVRGTTVVVPITPSTGS